MASPSGPARATHSATTGSEARASAERGRRGRDLDAVGAHPGLVLGQARADGHELPRLRLAGGSRHRLAGGSGQRLERSRAAEGEAQGRGVVERSEVRQHLAQARAGAAVAGGQRRVQLPGAQTRHGGELRRSVRGKQRRDWHRVPAAVGAGSHVR